MRESPGTDVQVHAFARAQLAEDSVEDHIGLHCSSSRSDSASLE